MASTIARLNEKGILPLDGSLKWMRHNIHFECYMGSVAYGASNDTSDMDVYAWCIPPKEVVFPHLYGWIKGFGSKPAEFDNWSRHHVKDKDAIGGKGREYDFSVYSVIQFFNLCMAGNPNMVDALFVPQRCVLHESELGHMVREQRKLFLHKGCFPKFKGYAYGQLNKIKNKNAEGKRVELIEKYGYDVKFAYHIVRLLLEIEQILEEGDLTLDRNGPQLKEIRSGNWKLDYLIKWADDKMGSLEDTYARSALRPTPDEDSIKDLLVKVLSHHFQDISAGVKIPKSAEQMLDRISDIVDEFRDEYRT